jgi:imidazolonepropionase-like amidohydrolase
VNTAKLIGIEKNLRTAQAGKRAELVAVVGKTLDDIKLLAKAKLVMKGGGVVKGRN